MVKVSVIIPIYNKEEYLDKTIQSVLNQTFIDFEILLLDDGSTDNSKNIAMKFADKDKRIKYYFHENIGVSKTRNKGIDLSRGDFVSFLDADDVWMPDFLKKMYAKVKTKNTVYCGTYIITNQEFIKKKIVFNEKNVITEYLKNKTKPPTNCWMVRRSFLDKHQIRFPEGLKWGEDSTFFIKILVHDRNVNYVDEYLSAYNRDVEGNLSVDTLGKIDEDLTWLKLIAKYISDNVNESREAKKYIHIIETYIIPGTILYRINSNLNKLDKKKVQNLLQKYKKNIKCIPVSNGLRSVKLILLKYKILLKINFL